MPRPCPDRCNILLLGTGGREHALAWKLRQSPRLGELLVEPGANAGLLALGRPCPEPISTREIFRLNRWCDRESIHLVVIGPEAPLAEGFADLLAEGDRKVFGPSKEASRLEWDKAYAKQMMRAASVPTAEGRTFTSLDAALAYVSVRDEPCVVKAAGLAAGKGVVVCEDAKEAELAVRDAMQQKVFGEAGRTIVVEERLEGPELSVMALVDGRTLWVLDACQDHKRVGEGDTGPNTGGMGAYSPVPLATESLLATVEREVLVPIVDALRREEIEYRGVLYAGLMLTPGGPKVLEFNCRFGDPETEPLLTRLQGDLVDILWRTATGSLDEAEIAFDPRAAVGTVVCAAGYPAKPRTGDSIEGIAEAEALAGPGEEIVVFQAGTAPDASGPAGSIVTKGGRVLVVTALAADLRRARDLSREAAGRIRFQGAFFRSDLAERVLGGTRAGIAGGSVSTV